MAWQILAAAALPYVASMFQDQPDAPSYQRVPLNLPDRSPYMNRILEMGFNPNHEMYRLASESAANNVNRLLARSGMRGSSVGAQLMINNQSALANAYTQDQLNKAMSAMNLVNQYDLDRERIATGASDAAYNRAMDAYNRQRADNASAIQGIAGLAQAGAAAYGQHQANQRWDEMMAKTNHFHGSYVMPAPVSYGVPGPSAPPVNNVAAGYYGTSAPPGYYPGQYAFPSY